MAEIDFEKGMRGDVGGFFSVPDPVLIIGPVPDRVLVPGLVPGPVHGPCLVPDPGPDLGPGHALSPDAERCVGVDPDHVLLMVGVPIIFMVLVLVQAVVLALAGVLALKLVHINFQLLVLLLLKFLKFL